MSPTQPHMDVQVPPSAHQSFAWAPVTPPPLAQSNEVTRLAVPQPTGHCNCTLDIAVMKEQIAVINRELAELSGRSSASSLSAPSVQPAGHADQQDRSDPQPQARSDFQPQARSDSQPDHELCPPSIANAQSVSRRRKIPKRRFLLPTPVPQVWLPGHAPSFSTCTSSWPPLPGRRPRSYTSRSVSACTRATTQASVPNLIDLN